MLMSQAVYVAFCKSFNDSFQRFDERFKDSIVNAVHEWITGMYCLEHSTFCFVHDLFLRISRGKFGALHLPPHPL